MTIVSFKNFHTLNGIIRSQNSDVILTDCEFQNNWSYGSISAGAVLTLLDSSTATITHCTFMDNIGGYDISNAANGAIMIGGGSGHVLLEHSEGYLSTGVEPAPGSVAEVLGTVFTHDNVDSSTFPTIPTSRNSGYKDITFITPTGSEAASSASFNNCRSGFTQASNAAEPSIPLQLGMDVNTGVPPTSFVTGGNARSFECEACEAGEWKGNNGMGVCAACPEGTYSVLTGGDSIDSCLSCPQGKATDASDNNSEDSCKTCPAGKYANGSGAACEPCGEGTYAASPGSTSCDLCVAGKFGNITGAFKCNNCEIGTYSNQPRAESCNYCPAGMYGIVAGQDKPSTACEICPTGMYSEAGATECLYCGLGAVPKQNGKSCQTCPAGQIPKDDNSTCVACGLNTYNSNAGGTECTSCPPNMFTSQSGQKQCSTCGASEYLSNGNCVQLRVNQIPNSKEQSNPTVGGGVLPILGSGLAPPEGLQIRAMVNGVECPTITAENSRLTCAVPPGSGTVNLVTVKEVTTNTVAELTGNYVTYKPPVVYKVTGCDQAVHASNQTVNCPTKGEVEIIVTGENFGMSGAMVSVGGMPCVGVIHSGEKPHNELICTLPAGTGTKVAVTVTIAGQSGYGEILSYASAEVTGFSGCPMDICPRDGKDAETGEKVVIVIRGTNFGPKQAVAVIGGQVCEQAPESLWVDPDGGDFDPHTTLVAYLSTGSGVKQMISVLQASGTFSEGKPFVRYQECQHGEYNFFEESKSRMICVPCEEGYYSDEIEQMICKMCPSDHFTTGPTHCEECPAQMTSGPRSPSCHCKDTFILVNGECMCEAGTQLDEALDQCTPCPMHTYQPGANIGECTWCDDLIDGSTTVDIGSNSTDHCICEKEYYNDGAACVVCEDGMECDEVGVTLKKLKLSEGYWRHSANTTDIRECPKEHLCLGGEHGEYCPEYNNGPYCLTCKDGAGGNWESECQSCEDSTGAMTSFFVFVGILLAVCGGLFFIFKKYVPPKSARGVQVMLKIVLAGSQIISAIPSVFDIKLPTMFEEFLKRINFINLDIFGQLSAGCLATVTYYDLLFWTCVLPLGMGAVVLVIAFLKKAQLTAVETATGERHERRHRNLKHLTATILFLLSYVAYPGASMAIFSIFPCDAIGNKRYLKVDYGLKCDTTIYFRWQGFAWIMALVYPVGVPLMYSYLLYKYRKNINPQVESKSMEDQMTTRDKDPDIKILSFLWISYKPSCWWFEIFECVRRLLMTGGLVFIDQGSPLQVSCGITITFFSLFYICWFKPYVTKRDNLLASFQQVNQFLVLIAVMLILTKSNGGFSDDGMAYMMIFLYSASGISLLVCATFEILNEIGDDEESKNHKEFHVDSYLNDNMRTSDSTQGSGLGREEEIVVEAGGVGGIEMKGFGSGGLLNVGGSINPLTKTRGLGCKEQQI
ncbi:hypothetical protein TrLO_g10263 [Triparma laevis f. longispina]|uniref:Tyrosine-protein kinase ephrin type A/B receptor-like domain-containing protein n=1 Tax=Triparma laevis f. longispina TaxID=1714387 RepID=A0A9W7B2W3_9STRA|nr:hypothetical protein TrLO_g10263 [Triparma laevis f. longispina]